MGHRARPFRWVHPPGPVIGVRRCSRGLDGRSRLRDAGTPRGTAYAVWVGIGASLTVVYSMATVLEPVSALKIAFLAMIIGGVIGLKVVH